MKGLNSKEIAELCEYEGADASVVGSFLRSLGGYGYTLDALERAEKWSVAESWSPETLHAIMVGIGYGIIGLIEIDYSTVFDDSEYLELGGYYQIDTGYEKMDFGLIAAELGSKLGAAMLLDDEKQHVLLSVIGSIADVLFPDVRGVAFIRE